MAQPPIGNRRVNTNPCTEQQHFDNWSLVQEIHETIIESPTIDDRKVYVDSADAALVNPQYVYDKLIDDAAPGTYDDADHSLVFAEVVVDSGSRYIRFFVDRDDVTGGSGPGDTDDKDVLVSVDDTTPGFLFEKLDSRNQEASGTYDLELNFLIQCEIEDEGLDEHLFFYAPYNIIKTSAADGVAGYLEEKFEDIGVYDEDDHIIVMAEEMDGTMRLFVPKSEITELVAVAAALGVRYAKVTEGCVVPAGGSGLGVTPDECSGLVELVRDPVTGLLEAGDVFSTGSVIYPFPDEVYIPSGRYKVGILLPDNADPEILVLQPLGCASFVDVL